MHPREAGELLGEVRERRTVARRAVDRPWTALVGFGLAAAISAPAVLAAGAPGIVTFWVLVGAVGAVALRVRGRRVAERDGIAAPASRWHLALAMFVGCLVLGAVVGPLVGHRAALLVPMVAVLVGYVVLGALHRDIVAPACAAPATVLGAVLIGAGARPWVAELCFGLALAGGGLALRAADRRRRP